MGFYDHYTKRSRNKLGERVKRLQARKIFELGRMAFVGAPTSILEIGPGDGYIADLARSSGCSYLAIEGSASVSEAIKAKGYQVITSMVPPLPETDMVDVCYMLHVIEHMKDVGSAESLLGDIARTLSKNGALVIACPDYIRWGYRFFDCDYTHQLPMTHRRLRQLLENEGYQVSYQGTYAGPIFGWFSVALHWVARLLYPQFLDDVLSRVFPSDIFYRGYLTIMPCLLVVATKKQPAVCAQ
jgi:SAM-dependent methyltransferase